MLASHMPVTQAPEPSPDSISVQDLVPGNIDVFLDDWQPNQVTGGDLLAALIAVAVGIALGWVFGRLTRWALLRWSSTPPFGAELAGRLVMYLTILIGVVIALESIGLTFGPLVIIVAVLVMGIWAMRPLLQNMSAGLLLQARGPFQPGEEIQSLGFEGEVEELDSRVVQIRTPDGRRIHIPNQEIVNNPIVNLSEIGSRRSVFDLGVAYDTDLDHAVEVIRGALQNTPGVLSDPQPEAFVHEFDDSNITISVWLWHGPEIYTAWKVKDEAARATVRALRAEGIVISFPRRTLAWAE
jgi:small conductance mechanosensitive channel